MQRVGLAFIGITLSLFPGYDVQTQPVTQTIEVHARRYAFEPSRISLNAGETVRLRLISDDVPHSLLVKQLSLDLTATKSHPGETLLTAKEPGDYLGRCGRFCGSGHGRMEFTVHVNRN